MAGWYESRQTATGRAANRHAHRTMLLVIGALVALNLALWAGRELFS